MKPFSKIVLVIVFLLGGMSSCDSLNGFWPWGKTTPKAMVQKKIAVGAQPVGSPQPLTQATGTGACQNFLADFPTLSKVAFENDGVARVTIESNKIIDEVTLAKWVQDFGPSFFAIEGCGVNVIRFSVSLSEESFCEGVIGRNDYDYFKRGKISEAEWIKRLEIRKLDTQQAMVSRLRRARENGDLEAALAAANKLLESDFSNATVQMIRANTLSEQSAFIEAVTAYEEILAAKPDHDQALYNLAVTKTGMGSYAEASALYTKILAKMDNPAERDVVLKKLDMGADLFFLQVAENFLKNNQNAEAGVTLNRVGDKRLPEFVLLQAVLLRSQQKAVEARDLLYTMMDTGQHTSEVLFNMTVLSLDLKDEKAARDYYALLKEADADMARELAFLSPLKDQPPVGNQPAGGPSVVPQTEQITVVPVDAAVVPVDEKGIKTSETGKGQGDTGGAKPEHGGSEKENGSGEQGEGGEDEKLF